MEDKYTLELNKAQLRLVAKALEMHSRMRCGQIEESFLPPIQEKIWSLKGEELQKKRKIVDESLETIKETLWPELRKHETYGVGHDNEADLGYEMYKEILYQFEKENRQECQETGKEYFWNVHSDKPCLKFTKEPTIKIEKHG